MTLTLAIFLNTHLPDFPKPINSRPTLVLKNITPYLSNNHNSNNKHHKQDNNLMDKTPTKANKSGQKVGKVKTLIHSNKPSKVNKTLMGSNPTLMDNNKTLMDNKERVNPTLILTNNLMRMVRQ